MSRLAPFRHLGGFLLCPHLGTDLREDPFDDETDSGGLSHSVSVFPAISFFSIKKKKKKGSYFSKLDYFAFYSIVSSILLYTPNEKNRESFRAFSCVRSSSIAERCSNVTVSGHKYKIPLCFALLTGRQNHFSKWSFLQYRIKYSISTEFQPVNSVYHQ